MNYESSTKYFIHTWDIIWEYKPFFYTIMALSILLVIIGIIILLNQRKIRKELRQLREMMETTSSDDKNNDG